MSFVLSVRPVRVAGKWTVYLFIKVKKIFVTPIVNKILQMSPTRLWVWPHCSWPRCPLSSWTDLWRLQVTIQINKQTNKQLNNVVRCLEAGCQCDPSAADPDALCPRGQTCQGCRCLQPGCNCDPTAENPDDLCPAGQTCEDCRSVVKLLWKQIVTRSAAITSIHNSIAYSSYS